MKTIIYLWSCIKIKVMRYLKRRHSKLQEKCYNGIKMPDTINCRCATVPITMDSFTVYNSDGEIVGNGGTGVAEILGFSTEKSVGQSASFLPDMQPLNNEKLEQEIDEAVKIIWKYGDIL